MEQVLSAQKPISIRQKTKRAFTSQRVNDPKYVWVNFGQHIPKVMEGLESEFDLYETMKLWDCFVVYHGLGPCAVAFFSHFGDLVRQVHLCVLPHYLRHAPEMARQQLREVAARLGATVLTTQAPAQHKVNKFLPKFGFKLTGVIPVSTNSHVTDYHFYRMDIEETQDESK